LDQILKRNGKRKPSEEDTVLAMERVIEELVAEERRDDRGSARNEHSE
jgi:hypothetical protein